MTAFAHDIHYDIPIHDDSKRPASTIFLTPLDTPQRSFANVIYYQQNQGREVSLSTDHTFESNVDGQQWCFSVKDVIDFFWSKGSFVVSYQLHTEGTPELLRYWFLHTLCPVFLTIEGIFEFIHAGGVEINDHRVLFIAPSHGGKSTLTDYFIRQNHTMISDDRVALLAQDDKIVSVPSYPYHRPYRKMEDLGVSVDNFAAGIQALDAIYVLRKAPKEDPVHFNILRGLEKYKALQYNFDFNLPLNKARSFELIAKIAKVIDVYSIDIPWDLTRLHEVYEAICQHHKSRIKSSHAI